jgi:hypothetical protein
MRHDHDWGYLLFLAAWMTMLMGCASPEAVIRVEEAQAKAISNYAASMTVIARQTLDAYRREALAHARYKARAALDSQTGTDGKVAREIVETVAVELARIEGEIAAEVAKAERALAQAAMDLDDAESFRTEVRRWLAAGGVEPETARSIGDMILERLK